MYIKNIELKDFRSYESLSLKFNKKVNLILGANAQGKTNLLESIYMASIGRSFRTVRDAEMIRFGADFAKIYIEALKGDMEKTVEITVVGNSKKSIKKDGIKLKKTSELLDNIYIVIFSPEDMKIVKDEPEKRRKFIDKELCQIKPSYYNNLCSYKKILSERNAYLKGMYVDPMMIEVWNEELSRYGAELIRQRKEFIDKLKISSSEINRKITNGKEDLVLSYAPDISYEEDRTEQKTIFKKILDESLDTDIRNRNTSRGPHRDDLDFTIISGEESIDARKFGSQGQQRTAALSLKLAEIDIIKRETGEDPILLLDDVMSELDMERQEFLVKALLSNQLFITTTEIPESILKEFPDASEFHIKKGKVVEKSAKEVSEKDSKMKTGGLY